MGRAIIFFYARRYFLGRLKFFLLKPYWSTCRYSDSLKALTLSIAGLNESSLPDDPLAVNTL